MLLLFAIGCNDNNTEEISKNTNDTLANLPNEELDAEQNEFFITNLREDHYSSEAYKNKLTEELVIAIKYRSSNANLTEIQKLIDDGANVNVKSDLGIPLIAYAVYNSSNTDLKKIEILLKNGANPNAVGSGESIKSALTYAAEYNKVGALNLLFSYGVEIKNADGLRALNLACLYGNIEIVQILLEKGLNPNSHFVSNITIANPEEGKIFYNFGKLEIETLGKTPLMFATQLGKVDIMRLLLLKGADVNAKEKNGWTPLIFSMNGNYEKFQIIIENGGNLMTLDNKNWTPLMWATMNAKPEMVEYLITNRVDVNVKNTDNQTALSIIEEKINEWGAGINYIEIKKMLIDAGAK